LLARYLQFLWANLFNLVLCGTKISGKFLDRIREFCGAKQGIRMRHFVLNSAIRPVSRLVLFLHLSEAIYKWSGTQFIWEEYVAKWKEKPAVALIAGVPTP
jgi:hypothetical protein